jgi:hypothetical protein
MTRAMDLDSVAPDDVVEVKPDFTKSFVEEKREKITPETDFMGDLTQKVYDIAGHTKSSFSSLLINPHVFDFEERDSDEKIILVARPHWFTNVSWIITSILLIIAPIFLKFIPVISDILAKYQTIGILIWYLVTFAFAFENFLSWYFDVYIITNKRVVDINFNNLLDKKFSSARLSMIQDITSRVRGVEQTLFNYGTVFIQTAAEVAVINFEMVPHPEKIIKVLQVLRENGQGKEVAGGRIE